MKSAEELSLSTKLKSFICNTKKKVFMDETTGEPFPQTIDALREGFNTLAAAASEVFLRDYCGRN